jgi:hypothetical protein
MATTLRFVLLGDDRASQAFSRFTRNVDGANRSIDRNEAALKKQGDASRGARLGILGLGSAVLGVDSAFKLGSGKASIFAKAMLAVNVATGVAEPALAGLVVVTGALAGSLVSAGAGLAAYGLALKPVLGQVSELMKAQALAAKGGAAAQQAYQKMLNKTPPMIVAFAKEVTSAQKQYHQWADSLAAPVLAPLQTALSQVRPVLVAIRPLVVAAADALETLVTQLARKIEGGGLTRVVQTILPHVQPAILGLARALGNVVAGVWGVVKAFLPMSDAVLGGVVKLTARFKEWGNSLPSHSGFQSLMKMFHDQTPAAVQVLKNLALIIKNVAAATIGLASPANSKALLQILVPLTQVMAQLTKNQGLVRAVIYFLLLRSALVQVKGAFLGVQKGLSIFGDMYSGAVKVYGVVGRLAGGFGSAEVAASAFSGTAGTLGGKLSTVVSALGSATAAAWASSVAFLRTAAAWVAAKVAAIATTIATKAMTAGQWLLNAAMDANPIGIVVIALAALGVAFYIAWTKSATFRKIIIGAWKVIKDTAVAVIHWFSGPFVDFFAKTVPATFNRVLTWVKRNWPWLLGALTGPIGLAVVWIIKHWAQILNGMHDTWSKIVNFLTSLPGKINGFFRGALGWLFQAGKNVIWGLFHGLTAIWNKVTSFISGIAGWIKSHKGPIALDQKLLEPAGRALMSGLHAGLLSGAGGVFGFITSIAGTIGGLLSKGIGGALGGAGGGSWTSTILMALKLLGQPASWLPVVMHRLMQESGGSATAVNRTDINWQHGTPSVGGMQVIGPTFAAYAGPFRNVGPFMYGVSINKLANVYAGLNYALHRYGSLAALMQPGGYAAGSWSVPRTGPAVVHRGEMIIPEPLAQAVRQVLTGGGGGRGGRAPVLHVEHMTVSDPADALLLARSASFYWRHGGGLG